MQCTDRVSSLRPRLPRKPHVKGGRGLFAVYGNTVRVRAELTGNGLLLMSKHELGNAGLGINCTSTMMSAAHVAHENRKFVASLLIPFCFASLHSLCAFEQPVHLGALIPIFSLLKDPGHSSSALVEMLNQAT